MYHPDGAALITRFFTEAGVGEVVDFMPPAGLRATDNRRIVRMLRCTRGRMRFEVELAPRFDFGRESHRVQLTDHGAVLSTDTLALTVHVVREPGAEGLADLRVDEGDLHLSLELEAGQVRGLLLESAADGPPREITAGEIRRMFDDLVRFWRSWLAQSTYRGGRRWSGRR